MAYSEKNSAYLERNVIDHDFSNTQLRVFHFMNFGLDQNVLLGNFISIQDLNKKVVEKINCPTIFSTFFQVYI